MKICLVGDMHQRDDTPLCRTDDYWQSQILKNRFLKKKAKELNAIVIQAGDLLNKWKPSPECLTMCIQELPFMYTVAGNHDLPQHSKDLFYKSGLATLEAAGVVQVLTEPTVVGDIEVVPFSWGDPLHPYEGSMTSLAVAHMMVWETIPFPGASIEGNASSVMRSLRKFDMILTGDNHDSFKVSKGKQTLLNPGSMMRMSAKQLDFKPLFYIWDTESGSIEPCYFPLKNDVVSIRHIEIENEKDERVSSFIKSISEEIDLGLDFISNVQKAVEAPSVSKSTKQVVREVLDECNA